MDECMKHICNEVGIPSIIRGRLEEQGVCTTDDLLNIQERILNRELKGVRSDFCNQLLVVADWIQSHPDANIISDFNGKVFADDRFAEEYIRDALGQPDGDPLLHSDVESDEELLQMVIDKVTAKVMTPKLQDACGNFDYKTYLDRTTRHLHGLVGQDTGVSEKIFIVAGKTQSGKTSVKGVTQSQCGLLRMPLIILTKGVGESIDLHVKLVVLADGTLVKEENIIVASNKHDKLHYRVKNERVMRALQGKTHGGTLVIADTKQQVINKACIAIKTYREKVPCGKWALIVDEADAMFRTAGRTQVFEQALQQLLNLGPSMTVMISATPVPFMLELALNHGKEEDIELFNLQTRDDYVGVENLQPLEVDGKKVYLEQNELTPSTVYTSDDGVEVCYANDKVFALYDDALSTDPTANPKKGILILDVSCPRVYATCNLKDKFPLTTPTLPCPTLRLQPLYGINFGFPKASAVQDIYKAKDRNMVVITVSGNGISYRPPDTDEWDETYEKSLIGTLLRDVDDQHGMEMPVMIFGYTKMQRGISFRSDKRVPTHMLISLGRGHNISTVIQTAGRATFNGRNELEENGFENVTVLMTSGDQEVCLKMQEYIKHVARRMQLEGDSFLAAMTGATERIPGSANFVRSTFREIGRIKGGRVQFEDRVEVDPVYELSQHEEAVKDKFWLHQEGQQLLRSLAMLRKGYPKACRTDIIEDLREREDVEVNKTKLTTLLRKFCDEGLVSKEKVAANEKEMWYRIPQIDRLVKFMNPEEGEIHDIDEDAIDEDNESNDGSVSQSDESLGTREAPIELLDSDDEHSSMSSLSMATAGSNKRKRDPRRTKAVTPEAEGNKAISTSRLNKKSKDDDSAFSMSIKLKIRDAPEDFVGKQVAKFFYVNGRKLYIGTVKKYCAANTFWHILFEDGDECDFDEEELAKGICCYKKHWSKDHTNLKSNKSITSASSNLTNIEDIPLGDGDNVSERGSYIIQPEKNRRVYYTDRGDTPISIAKRFKMDPRQIVRDNKRRPEFGRMNMKTKFTSTNCPIILPIAPKEKGVVKYNQRNEVKVEV